MINGKLITFFICSKCTIKGRFVQVFNTLINMGVGRYACLYANVCIYLLMEINLTTTKNNDKYCPEKYALNMVNSAALSIKKGCWKSYYIRNWGPFSPWQTQLSAVSRCLELHVDADHKVGMPVKGRTRGLPNNSPIFIVTIDQCCERARDPFPQQQIAMHNSSPAKNCQHKFCESLTL